MIPEEEKQKGSKKDAIKMEIDWTIVVNGLLGLATK